MLGSRMKEWWLCLARAHRPTHESSTRGLPRFVLLLRQALIYGCDVEMKLNELHETQANAAVMPYQSRSSSGGAPNVALQRSALSSSSQCYRTSHPLQVAGVKNALLCDDIAWQHSVCILVGESHAQSCVLLE